MEKKRNIITILIVITILIILLVTVLLLVNRNSNEKEEQESNNIQNVIKDEIITSEKDITQGEIIKVKACLSNYLSVINKRNPVYYTINSKGEEILAVDRESITENIIALLDTTYIKKNTVTSKNVFNYVDDINTNVIVDILQIRRYMNSNSYQYAVYCIIQDNDNNLIKKAYYNVYIDMNTNAFGVEPILSHIENIDSIKSNDVIVTKNDYNEVPANNSTENESLKEKFNMFKRLMLSDTGIAYDYLDEKYRTAKFGTQENFEKYVETKRAELKEANLTKYKINTYNEYLQYIFLDQNNNYYIFNETEPLNYKVILDTYTIDLPEFTDKYVELGEVDKVKANIQRIFDSINDNDYRYLYNKLDETFKQNNFPNVEDLEKYMKNNFFTNNSLQSSTYDKKDGIYICNVQVKNGDNQEEGTEKEFIMQLKEGTDFVVSFNVE